MPIEIKKSELEKLINEDRLKMEQLAAHYNLPLKTIKDIVKKAGLRIRNYSRVPKAVFVDDTAEIPSIPPVVSEMVREEEVIQPLVQAVVNSQEEIAATTEPPVINPPIITEIIPEAVQPETPSTEDFIF